MKIDWLISRHQGGAVAGVIAVACLLSGSACAAELEPEPADTKTMQVQDVPHESSEDLRIALTFDDVPFVARRFRDRCDGEEMVALNRKLLAAIERENIPATALVVASRACGPAPEQLLTGILEEWLDDGHALGNHTYSHRDLNGVTLEWYLNDIRRGAEVLDPLLETRGQEERWFRSPLLHTGDTREKAEGLSEFLSENGYRVAPVTVDNQEWVFAAVYEAALEAGDDELAERVGEGFVRHIAENLTYYEQLSDSVFGRQIPQVLLLHSNLMNIDYLDELTAMIRDRGYDLIPLAEATSDPAYASENDYVGSRGLSWLQRWALTRGIEPAPEPREPDWIAERFRQID